MHLLIIPNVTLIHCLKENLVSNINQTSPQNNPIYVPKYILIS
jgi:hypothetical protein